MEEGKRLQIENAIETSVKDRTEKQHLWLVKHYGGVREYLLTMGEFKSCDEDSEDGKKYQDNKLQYCYDKGFDNIKNGSNTINSNYALFSTKEKLKAWEHGRKDANSGEQE
jgi:hypothetical protein